MIEIQDTFQSSQSTSFHKTQQQSTPILMQVFERVWEPMTSFCSLWALSGLSETLLVSIDLPEK